MRVKADMHIHTSVSDGKPSPAEAVLEALSKGLTVVSITDHDTFEGSIKALKIVKEEKLDIIVVVGAEIRTDAGDILVYCAEEPLDKTPRDPLELSDYARENGCLVVPAHPFDIRRKGIGSLVYEYPSAWDAIEVFNAMSDPLSNRQAEEAAKRLNLPGLANSDAHVASAIGSAYTIIDVEGEDALSVIKAVKRGLVTPVPGRPSLSSILHQAAWSIERRILRRRREKGYGAPSRLDYLEDEGV